MILINEHNIIRRDNYIKKLVSNARAIISNQIGLPLGASKMVAILDWTDQIEPIKEIDLSLFKEYKSKTLNLPIGTDRLTYNPAFLRQQDKLLDNLTMQYKDKLIDKCFEIIELLADKKQS